MRTYPFQFSHSKSIHIHPAYLYVFTYENCVLSQGYGLMIFEDKTYYEGELGVGGTLAGRGVLHYPGGDTFEGTFAGSWEDSIKISGVLHKRGAAQCISAAMAEEETLPK